MKKNLGIISTALLAASLTFSSCTKSSNSGSAAAPFVGTWNGSTTCSGAGTPSGGSLVLSGSGNTVTGAGNVGTGSCYKNITYSGTASGNNVSFPTQTFTDLCGLSYTIAANGTISGSTLTFNIIITGAAGNTSCTFTGTK